MKKILIVLLLVLLAGAAWFLLGRGEPGPVSGEVQDEAMAAGYTAADFPGSDSDYLRDMDKGATASVVQARLAALGLELSEEEAWSRYNRGRINWAVWTGGNDRFWNEMTHITFGTLDLLKTVSSHPNLTYEGNGQE